MASPTTCANDTCELSEHNDARSNVLVVPPEHQHEGVDAGAEKDGDVDPISLDHTDVQLGVKRQRSTTPMTSDHGAAPSGTKRHVAGKPPTNASKRGQIGAVPTDGAD